MEQHETIEERWRRTGPPERLLRPPWPPHTPDETEALIRACVAAAENWEKSGRLVRLGPRRYEYHLVSMRKDNE